MHEFFSILKPINTFHNKVRIGPAEDGGYVIPEIVINECTALMTYGVGYDSRYEDEFAKIYNKPVYMFDHTVGYDEFTREDGVRFIKQGLGFGENCKDWYTNYTELGLTGDIFLKIDIEGHEYEWFKQTDINSINNNVSGMILETHWINGPEQSEGLKYIMNVMSDQFYLCHIHGNNWAGTFDIEDYQFPLVLELSFINKKYVTNFEVDTQDYPISGLDIPNNPNEADHILSFLKNA